MILNRADRASADILAFCQEVGASLGTHVFAVAYLTPPSSKAVPVHNDDQDVFVSQLWGSKRWQVYEPHVKGPIYTEEMEGKDGPAAQPLNRYLEVDLRAGDWLYCPRGHLHEALSGPDVSLHLTVTLPTSDSTVGMCLMHAWREAMRDAAPEVHPLLRRAVVPRVGGLPPEEVAAGVAEMARLLTPDRVAATSRRRYEQLEAARASQVCHDELEELIVYPEFEVRLRPGLDVECEAGGDVAVFSGEQGVMRLRISPTVSSLIVALGQHRTFQQVRKLPGADFYERLCICQLLYDKECLQVLTGRGIHERVAKGKGDPFKGKGEPAKGKGASPNGKGELPKGKGKESFS